MGRAIDLFVTYRFLKLLTTPFNKTDAFKLGIIDADGNRVKKPKSTQPAIELATTKNPITSGYCAFFYSSQSAPAH